MGSGLSTANSRKWSKREAPNAESSRVLFLLYLIHRTWNVVVEHVDSKSNRWRGSHTVPSSGEGLGHRFDSVSLGDSDPGSCYSTCSCSYCRLRECAQDCVRYVVSRSYTAVPEFNKLLEKKVFLGRGKKTSAGAEPAALNILFFKKLAAEMF